MFQKPALLVLCTVFMFSVNAHFMSGVWPQKGLASNDIGNPAATKKVLIAGKGSEFRDTVISRLVDKLKNDSVFIKIVDLKDVDANNPDNWNAILIVNMCVGWDYDNRVRKFVRQHPDNKNIVLFTTSGDPKECIPEKNADRLLPLDGYTSASVKEKVVPAVDTLYKMVGKYLR